MNTPLYTTAWIVALLVSLIMVYQVIGYRGLTSLFPEGRRWWHLPLEIASLGFFAAVVLYHPF